MTDSTANAETQAAPSTDTRGSPRLFWVGMAVFLIVMVFLGFGSTYGRQIVMGTEIGVDGPYDDGLVATDWVIHLHTVVFVGWLALLLAQATLVARGRTQAHMTLGRYGGIALGALVLLTGASSLPYRHRPPSRRTSSRGRSGPSFSRGRWCLG